LKSNENCCIHEYKKPFIAMKGFINENPNRYCNYFVILISYGVISGAEIVLSSRFSPHNKNILSQGI
jgi:hypothetical protein